ncbi:hypothetical protein [Actibacterium sp. D379-3]
MKAEFVTIKGSARLAGMLVLALVVAGCAAPLKEEVGECEPGVAGISHAATVTPPGC